eukprot:CAMPEP_0172391352 /NCGR_PEP_ID=MMETSP1061-20121228/7773_1 /TAXON_ID=37318 /ORGANISM="Pseudo-nitzschia pungens, Strain cf. pungens" /LENGTH=312 /DNA_ID=CAMNT_0013121947 /DNA_START=513 /DNA_END=1451 /DNA_ORIENTATION=+
MIWWTGIVLVGVCFAFFSIVSPSLLILIESIISLAAVVAVYQERKVWLYPTVPALTPIGMLKVFGLNVVWMTFCFWGAVLIILESLVTKRSIDLKHTRKLAHEVVERNCAMLVCSLFVGPVEMKGTENLPSNEPGSPAPVYVANHASQIDSAVVYYVQRQWRWIMKSSIMYLPGVGQITYLGDHIWIDRVKRKKKSKDSITGARNLYVKSDASIQEGIPMFFFPQGTRRMGERLPFKDGAFNVATNNDSVLVPISINIPLTAWNSLYPFGKADPVVLTVHKPIESKGKDVATLKQETAEVIFSVLPDHSKNN